MLRERLGENVPPLPRAIISGWQQRSPVDCLVLSHDLELLGRQPVNDLFAKLRAPGQVDLFAAYQDFLTASQNGDRPGLDTRVAAAEVGPQLLIEALGGAKFRVNGEGPLGEEAARLRARAATKGVRAMTVQLKTDRNTVTQDQFDAISKLVQEEWKLFDDVPMAHFFTTGRNTRYQPE